MRTPEKPNLFDGFDDWREKKEGNRQAAYENKVCKKLLLRKFRNDTEELAKWTKVIKDTDMPLAAVQDLFSPMRLYTHRLQSWDVHSLFREASLQNHPIWQEFAKVIDDCSAAYPDHYPAMVFYNSAIAQDMVIHTCMDGRHPCGFFRLIRASKSGEGGVVIDTLDGFIEGI